SPTAWHFNLLAGPRAVGRQPHTGSRRYYHADLLGSVRAVVTGATVVEATDYDPWGVVLAGRSLGTPGSGTREGFTSQPRDLTVGWDDFGARQYLAAYGRWGGVDPRAGVMPEWSPYAYGLGNPVAEVDGTGEIPWSKVVKAAKAVVKSGGNVAEVADAFASTVSAVQTVLNPEAAVGTRLLALAEVAIELASPVGVDDVRNARRVVAAATSTLGEMRRLRRASGEAAGEAATRSAVELGGDAAKVTTPYRRPSGATTRAQRASVQGKPCVKCGTETEKQVAGHKTALIDEYYATGTIDKTRMRSMDAVQPECPTCSAREGAEKSRLSRQKKKELEP
ncbi:MAG: hypothetical protein JNL44_04135, partial [Gemmatimonadetes bacterium]|nr:hypothetical protein [Gemmatimonadota bacterium]